MLEEAGKRSKDRDEGCVKTDAAVAGFDAIRLPVLGGTSSCRYNMK